jgi:hypothetical protein
MSMMEFFKRYTIGSDPGYKISKRRGTTERVVIHFYPVIPYIPDDH